MFDGVILSDMTRYMLTYYMFEVVIMYKFLHCLLSFFLVLRTKCQSTPDTVKTDLFSLLSAYYRVDVAIRSKICYGYKDYTINWKNLFLLWSCG